MLLARQVRRDGEVRELEVEVPRGHRGTELLVLDVRLAPLGDHVLLLAEDQTAVRGWTPSVATSSPTSATS